MAASTSRPSIPRAVAVTIDDLPASPSGDLRRMQEITTKLLRHLHRHRIPAAGFVNENKLFASGEAEVAARTALLARWLDAGLELGNHTYSHPDLNRAPVERYQAEIAQGEKVTSRLLAARGRRIRYFRHPMLHTGTDARMKAEIDRFLRARGYTVAPVTVDNGEWIYAAAYERAARRGDRKLMRRIGADYLRYMDEVFAFAERLSREVVGREVRQTLLLHANALNAEYLGELAERIERRGYRFVSLAEALADPAYAQADPYVGPKGLSWLQRWAISQGGQPREEPPVSAFVEEAAALR